MGPNFCKIAGNFILADCSFGRNLRKIGEGAENNPNGNNQNGNAEGTGSAQTNRVTRNPYGGIYWGSH